MKPYDITVNVNNEVDALLNYGRASRALRTAQRQVQELSLVIETLEQKLAEFDKEGDDADGE